MAHRDVVSYSYIDVVANGDKVAHRDVVSHGDMVAHKDVVA